MSVFIETNRAMSWWHLEAPMLRVLRSMVTDRVRPKVLV